MRTISVQQLQKSLAEGATVIDVREPYEYALGYIEGTHNMPLSTLDIASIPNGAILVCASGGRSAGVAHALMERNREVSNVDGGIVAWLEAGYPIMR
jgi:rhodanese-related sulfurtransferase